MLQSIQSSFRDDRGVTSQIKEGINPEMLVVILGISEKRSSVWGLRHHQLGQTQSAITADCISS
jgi:hypothetical protein